MKLCEEGALVACKNQEPSTICSSAMCSHCSNQEIQAHDHHQNPPVGGVRGGQCKCE